VGKTVHKSSFSELLLLPTFIVLRPPTYPHFLPSDKLLFVGETEYCGRRFLKCVARTTGVINDSTENIICACYNE